MLNNIQFNKSEGGLGRALAGEDHICGILSFVPSSDIPAGFSSERTKQIFSLAEAEALGVSSDTIVPDTVKTIHYNLKMLFEANEKAVVFLAIHAYEGAGTELDPYEADLSKTIETQRFAEGKIRQIGVFSPLAVFEVGQIVSLQDAADVLEAEHKPLSIVYFADTLTFSSASLPDLRAQDAKNVSVVIGTDGAGLGNTYQIVKTGILGLTIGILSLAKVNENVGWVGRFNVAANSINELEVPALNILNAPLIKTLPPAELDTLNDKGYIFLIKHIGKAGTYFNDSHTAKAVTSDYAYIENNRTMDKAIRGVRAFLLPSLSAPLYVNNNGTLTEDTIASFRNDALRALEQMERDGEISAKNVVINPAQNVLSSSKITLKIEIIPVGVARKIEVNIGFAVKI